MATTCRCHHEAMGQKLKHLWRLLRIAWILSRWDALFPFRAQGTRHRASCRTFLFFANLVPRKRGLARFAHHRTSGRPLESSGGGAVGFAAPDAVSGRPGTPESGAMEAGAPDSGLGSRWMAGAGQTPPAAPVAARAAGGGRTAAGGVSRERRGPAARAGRRARARTAPAAGSRTGTRPGSCGR